MAKTLTLALVCTIFLALLAANGPSPNPQEAARLNNIGVAYMNQQLFEKALKAFEQAAAADPKFQIAQTNRGIALANLGRMDAARKFLEQE